MTVRVKKNFHNNITLELRRTATLVTAICNDKKTRRVVQIKAEVFDKEYQDFDYDAAKLAEKWLKAEGLIHLTERSKKELIMIIVLAAGKDQVLGRFEDAALAAACTPETAVSTTETTLAEDLNEKEMVALYNKYAPADKQITGRVKGGKTLFAPKLWDLIKDIDLTPVVGTVKKGDGPVAKAHLIFASNPGKSRKELIQLCVAAGINKATATTQYGAFHKGKENTSMERNGSVDKVRKVIAEHYGKKTRKEILDLCVAEGLNKATASTQYGKYNKEEKAKEAGNEPVAGAVEGAVEGAEGQAQEGAEGANEGAAPAE